MNLKNVRKSSHFGDCKQLVLSDQQSKEIQFITMWKSSKFSYFQKQENWKRSAIHPEIDSNVQTDDTNCRHLLSWWLIVSALVHTNVHTHTVLIITVSLMDPLWLKNRCHNGCNCWPVCVAGAFFFDWSLKTIRQNLSHLLWLCRRCWK